MICTMVLLKIFVKRLYLYIVLGASQQLYAFRSFMVCLNGKEVVMSVRILILVVTVFFVACDRVPTRSATASVGEAAQQSKFSDADDIMCRRDDYDPEQL